MQGSYGQGKFGKVLEKEGPIFQALKVWDFCENLEKVFESLGISQFLNFSEFHIDNPGISLIRQNKLSYPIDSQSSPPPTW